MNDVILLAVENPIPESLWNIISPALRLIAGIVIIFVMVSVIKLFFKGDTIGAVRRIVVVLIAMVFLFDPGIMFTLVEGATNLVEAGIDAVNDVTDGGSGNSNQQGGTTNP